MPRSYLFGMANYMSPKLGIYNKTGHDRVLYHQLHLSHNQQTNEDSSIKMGHGTRVSPTNNDRKISLPTTAGGWFYDITGKPSTNPLVPTPGTAQR